MELALCDIYDSSRRADSNQSKNRVEVLSSAVFDKKNEKWFLDARKAPKHQGLVLSTWFDFLSWLEPARRELSYV